MATATSIMNVYEFLRILKMWYNSRIFKNEFQSRKSRILDIWLKAPLNFKILNLSESHIDPPRKM